MRSTDLPLQENNQFLEKSKSDSDPLQTSPPVTLYHVPVPVRVTGTHGPGSFTLTPLTLRGD